MKTLRTLNLAALLVVLAFSTAFAQGAAVGKPAPDFSLTDYNGQTHSLSALKGKTVVLEWTNPGCPFIQKHLKEGTMKKLIAAHPDVVFLGVNSTSKDHKDFMTPEAYKFWASDHGLSYPILYDTDGKLGLAYGAKTTPDVFVINPEGVLVYAGAMDNDPAPKPGKSGSDLVNYVDSALSALAAGKSPNPAQTKPYGCGVKYPD